MPLQDGCRKSRVEFLLNLKMRTSHFSNGNEKFVNESMALCIGKKFFLVHIVTSLNFGGKHSFFTMNGG